MVRVWGMTEWRGCVFFPFPFVPWFPLPDTRDLNNEQRIKLTRIVTKRTRYSVKDVLAKNNNNWQPPESELRRSDRSGRDLLDLPGGMMSISAMRVYISFRSCRRPVYISRLCTPRLCLFSLECNNRVDESNLCISPGQKIRSGHKTATYSNT